MKKISLLSILTLLLITIASCSHSERYDARLFSVEVPDGLEPDEDSENNYTLINYVQLTDTADNNTYVIMAFPFEGNPEAVLHNQTVGGGNPALAAMHYPASRPEPFKFGRREGYEIAMSGVIEGIDVVGTGYCFNTDGCTFFVYNLTKEATPDAKMSRKIIESISVNTDEIESYDAERLVEGVADMARLNIPLRIDELTTWSGITTDHNKREVVMVMTLDGEASDYAGIDEHLASLRGAMVENLREGRDTDWLILVATDQGYSLGYDYVLTDGTPLASLRVSPDEVK
ncbi:MAG: hypothetical protein HDR83_02160 [Bacteroides sp.]|nr:hypothetical protein [Bacteroides sp.]